MSHARPASQLQSQQELDFLSFSPTLSQGERHLSNQNGDAAGSQDLQHFQGQFSYSSMYRPPVSANILQSRTEQPEEFMNGETHSDSSSDVDAAEFIENMPEEREEMFGEEEGEYAEEEQQDEEPDEDAVPPYGTRIYHQEEDHMEQPGASPAPRAAINLAPTQPQERHTTTRPQQKSTRVSASPHDAPASQQRISPHRSTFTTREPSQPQQNRTPQTTQQHRPATHYNERPASQRHSPQSTLSTPAHQRYSASPASSVYSNSSQKSVPESIEDIPKHLQKELTMKIRTELSDLVHRELRRIRKESEKIMRHEIEGLSQNDKLKQRIRELEEQLQEEQDVREQVENEYREKQTFFANEKERYDSLKARFLRMEQENHALQSQVTQLQSALEDKDRINRELDQRYQNLLKKTEFELAASRQVMNHALQEAPTPAQSNTSTQQHSSRPTHTEDRFSISAFEYSQMRTSPVGAIKSEDTLESSQGADADNEFESSFHMSSASQSTQSMYGAQQRTAKITTSSFEDWINSNDDDRRDVRAEEEPVEEEQQIDEMHQSALSSYGGTDLTDLLSGDPQAIAKSLISQARNPTWHQTTTRTTNTSEQHQQQQIARSPTSLSHGHSTTRFIPNATLPHPASPGTPTGDSSSIPEIIQRNKPLQHRFQLNAQNTDDDTPKRSRYNKSSEGEDMLAQTVGPEQSSLSQRATSSLAVNRAPLVRAESAPNIVAAMDKPQRTSSGSSIKASTKYEELLKQSTRKAPSKKRAASGKSGASTQATWSTKAKTLKTQLERHEAVVNDWKEQQSTQQQGYIQNVGILKGYFTSLGHGQNAELAQAAGRITRLLETLYNLWDNLETSFAVRQEFSSNMIHVLHIGEAHTPLNHQQQNVQVVEQKLGQVIHDYTQELMKQSNILSMIRQREALLVQIKQLAQQANAGNKKQILQERSTLNAQLKQLTKQLELALQQWSQAQDGHHFEYRGIPYEVLLKHERIKREYKQLEQEQQALVKWTKRAGV